MNTPEPDPTETPREEETAQRRTGLHPVNTGHLVMGVAFLGLVVAWALLTSDVVAIEDHGWVLGLPWLVAGAIGLLATVLRGPRQHWRHEHWRHEHWQHGQWRHEHWYGGGHRGDQQDHDNQGNHGSGSMHGWH